MMAAHGKQSLQHLVNLGRNKRTGALGTGANGINTGPQLTTKKNIIQHDTATNKTFNTKSSDKKSLKINLASF